MELRDGNPCRSTAINRGSSAALYGERLYGAAPLPLPQHDAVAGDSFISVQCGLRRARASAYPTLPPSRSRSTTPSLPAASDHDGRFEQSREWDGIDYHYWEEGEWRKFITPDDLPELKHWTPGTDLPLVHQTNHLRPPHIRAVQRLVHAFCLPTLDWHRPVWSDCARPQPIPPEIVRRLDEELRLAAHE